MLLGKRNGRFPTVVIGRGSDIANYMKTWAYDENRGPVVYDTIICEESFYRLGRVWNHDGSMLCRQDAIVCDLIGLFQPRITRDIYRGKLYINGE